MSLSLTPHNTIVELFESQVRQRAEHPAVAFGDVILSYAELNRRANGVAQHLAEQGVAAGSRVVLAPGRSELVVVGMLGVLKAACTYVPLDPDDPPARLRMLIEDADPAMLLTETRLERRLRDIGRPILSLDRLADDAPAARPVRTTAPDDVANMNFTSGSTGRPKGVMVTHRGIVNLVCGQRYLEFGSERTFMTVMPFNFASLAKSVGRWRHWQVSKCMI